MRINAPLLILVACGNKQEDTAVEETNIEESENTESESEEEQEGQKDQKIQIHLKIPTPPTIMVQRTTIRTIRTLELHRMTQVRLMQTKMNFAMRIATTTTHLNRFTIKTATV